MKIFFSIIGAYLLIGVIRTSLSWRANRLRVVAHLYSNPFAEIQYFRPWIHWIMYVIGWPFWWRAYKGWRREVKLIKANDRTQNRIGRSNA